MIARRPRAIGFGFSFLLGPLVVGAFGCASSPPRVIECDRMFDRVKELTGQGMSASDFARVTADLRAKLDRDPETARMTCLFALDAMSAPPPAPNTVIDPPAEDNPD